jgi:hypothetical protein
MRAPLRALTTAEGALEAPSRATVVRSIESPGMQVKKLARYYTSVRRGRHDAQRLAL